MSKKRGLEKTVQISDGYVSDGMVNLVANLGTPRDKASHTRYITSCMSESELLSAYRSSWLAAAIVDYPSEDATRNWRSWNAESDQISRIEAEEARLDLKSKVKEALISARLFGRAAIYINVSHSQQDQPLKDIDFIQSLVVVAGSQIQNGEIVSEITSPYYGHPEYYTISTNSGSQIKIHASRFAMFYGKRPPASGSTVDNTANGISCLESTLETIKQTDSTMANIASLVFEAKVDVFSLKGFANQICTDKGTNAIASRMHLQAAMKGINGAVVIDAEDSYEQKNASFGGLDAIANMFMKVVSGAARIPISRLFGRESAGLSGNGQGDEDTYYDRVKDIQSLGVGRAIKLIDECIINSALGSRPKEIFYTWSPLKPKSEKDIAEIFGKIATAARSIAGNGEGALIPIDALSDALVNALIESGSLPGLEQSIDKYGSLGEQGLPRGEDDQV